MSRIVRKDTDHIDEIIIFLQKGVYYHKETSSIQLYDIWYFNGSSGMHVTLY